jgi:hypothetical protein
MLVSLHGMAENGDDLLKQQKEIFDAFCKKGAELAEELHRLNAKLAEIERENHNLASLYVAAHRLHSAATPRAIVETVVEVLLNFVGAKRFAIFAVDDGRLTPVVSENAAGLVAPPLPDRPVYPAAPSPSAPIAVPMRVGDRVVGLIAVWELVSHKTGLERVDHELFNLLAARAEGLGSMGAP